MTGTATMKLKAIAILIVTGGMISHSALAGTTSATLTVDSIVTMGTCTAQLLDSNDKEISQVAIGDVYISELRNETNKKPLKSVLVVVPDFRKKKHW
jgi:type 1 fimbria pilin